MRQSFFLLISTHFQPEFINIFDKFAFELYGSILFLRINLTLNI